MQQRTIRILIADDHEIVRAGFARFISDQGDMRVTAEAATGDEVIAKVRHKKFDVVLLDISMPQKNGIDCLRVIRQRYPTLPVLILSSYPEVGYAIHMLRYGASGYCSKSARPEEVIRAIRTVARGERYLSDNVNELLSAELDRGSRDKPHDILSEREFQIFHKLAAGQGPTEIAAELHLSVKTISTYRARVLEKMKLKTNTDITTYAQRNSLLA